MNTLTARQSSPIGSRRSREKTSEIGPSSSCGERSLTWNAVADAGPRGRLRGRHEAVGAGSRCAVRDAVELVDPVADEPADAAGSGRDRRGHRGAARVLCPGGRPQPVGDKSCRGQCAAVSEERSPIDPRAASYRLLPRRPQMDVRETRYFDMADEACPVISSGRSAEVTSCARRARSLDPRRRRIGALAAGHSSSSVGQMFDFDAARARHGAGAAIGQRTAGRLDRAHHRGHRPRRRRP